MFSFMAGKYPIHISFVKINHFKCKGGGRGGDLLKHTHTHTPEFLEQTHIGKID